MNLPNAITLARLVITAVCLLALEWIDRPVSDSPSLGWIAFVLFVVAAVTDVVDGWVARRFGQVTPFGRIADPFVDKVLICGVLIALLRFPSVESVLDTWMVEVIVAREFLVTAVRGLAESEGIPFPADRLGKYKMMAQSITAGGLIMMVAGVESLATAARIGMWVTIVLTLWSGGHYVWKARGLLRAA